MINNFHKSIIYIFIITGIVLGAFSIVQGAFNEQINFQGKLTNNNNLAVPNGDYNFEFKLYATSSGGSALWTETATGTNRIAVTDGLFSHLLGSITSISSVDFNQTLWLEVRVGGTTTIPSWETLSPRKKLGAVPAAFVAKKAEQMFSGTSFPTSPVEGQIFYRTDTYQAYIYANSKWQADRTVATKIVAATSSQNYEKADYVCSGVSCEDEINSAINALPGGGGVVYLLEGTYNIATSTGNLYGIQIATSNVALIGSGKATILKRMWKATDYYDSGVITIGDGTNAYEGIFISQLQIDGNKVSYNSIYNNNIFFKQMISRSRIENTWIYNSAGMGIWLYASISDNSNSYNLIKGNEVDKNNGRGILTSYSSNNTIIGNTVGSLGFFGGNDNAGIDLSNTSTNNTITGNMVLSNNGAGISLSFSPNNTITGNTIQGNNTGISLDNSSSNNTITGNTIQGNSYHGIWIYSSSNNNTVTGNKIHDNGGSGNYDGIRVYTNANLVSSNDITDTDGGGYAINIYNSASENNYLIGNRYSGTGASSIKDSGTGTTIQHRDQFEVEASTTLTALTVSQTGTGTIATFSNATGSVFTIANNGTVTVAGSILPATTTTYDLGSATYKWANIYAATATIGNTIIIGGDSITATETLAMTAGAASTWKTTAGDLTIKAEASGAKLLLSSAATTTLTATDFLLNLGDAAGARKFYIKDSTGTTTFALDSKGNLDITGALYQPVYGTDDGLVGYWPFSEKIGDETATNTDFEIWTGNTPTDWSTFGTDALHTVSSSTAQKYSGSYSVKLSQATDTAADFGISQTRSVSSSATYQFNGWALYTSSGGPGAAIKLSAEGTGFTTVTQSLTSISSSWQFLSLRFTTGASTATTTIKFYLSGATTSVDVYLDKVSLKKANTTYTYDYSPYGNDGTIYGPSFANGKAGQAMQFDGVNDYINMPQSGSLNSILSNHKLTYEAWVYYKGGEVRDIVGFPTSNPRSGYTFQISSGLLLLRFQDAAGTWHNIDSTPLKISSNQWSHVAVTYDASAGQLVFYANGISKTVSESATTDNAGSIVRIGQVGWLYFDGLIDEVRIYNRALTADEIRAHYLRGTGAHGVTQADKFRVLSTGNVVNFQVDAAGNVGIGTTAPKEKLDIAGGLRLGLAPTTYTTTTEAVGSSSTTIPVVSTAGYPSAGTLLIDSEAITYATTTANAFGGATRGVLGTTAAIHNANRTVKNYLFTAVAISTTTPRMVILGDGNVGIGTTNPSPAYSSQKLTVAAANDNVIFTIQSGTTSKDAQILFSRAPYPYTDGSYYSWLGPDAANNFVIATYEYIPIIFQNDYGKERMRIATGGNIGIGTTTPAALLDVYASSSVTGNLLSIKNATGSVFVINNAGKITTGEWQATPIGSAYGGTGTSSASWTGFAYVTGGVWGTTTAQTGTEKYGPTVIVAAQNSTNTSRAHYQCDGTNDEAEINQAIQSIYSTGGTVQLLEGTYNIATSTGNLYGIQIATSNVALVGSGKATILKRAWNETVAANSGVITVGDGTNACEGIFISQLQIDGCKTGCATNYTNTNNHAIFFKQKISRSQIKSTWIYNNSGQGIYLYASVAANFNSFNLIEGNDVGTSRNGIYLSYSSSTAITGNTSQGNSLYGIFLSSSPNNTITGNTFQGNSKEGISLSSSSNNTITGNTVQGNSDYGIFLNSSCDNNTITGNTVQGNSTHGIYLYSSSNNTISGNKIHNNGGSGNSDGIYVSSDSDSNLISSNDITDTAGGSTAYAIEINSTSDNNYLVGNRYSGTGADSIRDSGIGTIYGSQLYGSSTVADLILKPLGNVGIGSTSTSAKLTVLESGTGTIVDIKNATGSVFVINNNGDITTGTWKATPIGAAYGGTGTSSASWTGFAYVTGGVWGTTTAQTGTEKYGPTVIVAAQNSTNTSRAHYQCDGTNDQDEIMSAINSISSTGGTVQLLEGTYNIASSTSYAGINIATSNIALVGSGKGTILKRAWDTAVEDGVITVGDGGTSTSTGIVITNLSIDGQKAIYTGPENTGIYFNQKVVQSKIENTWIYDCDGKGIYLYGTSGKENTQNIIKGNYVKNSSQQGVWLFASTYSTIVNNNVQLNNYGIRLEASSNYNNVISNSLLSNGYHGIYLDSSIYNNIANNNIYSSSQRGIYLLSNYNTVTGNTILSSGNDGIYLSSADYNTVTGNNVQSSGYHGIYILASGNTIISNVVNEVGPASAYDGIYLASGNNNLISSNRLYDGSGSRYGINVAGGSNNYLSNNEISGSGFASGEINDAGTNTTIQHRDQFEVEASTTLTALTVSQTGTGTIANFSNATGSVFTIANNGNVTVAGHVLPATTTTYDLGSATYKWRNIYAATGTFGGTITIGSNTLEGSATTTLFTTGNANQLVLGANGNVGIGTTGPQEKLTLASASNLATEMAVPTGVGATCYTSGGSMADGTYYFKVTASHDSSGTTFTTGSSEVSCTISGGGGAGRITIGWTAPTGASSFRVYKGTSSGGQDKYFVDTDSPYSWTTDIGATAGSVPSTINAYVNKLTASGNSWLLGGNVGIGTANPLSTLDVRGPIEEGLVGWWSFDEGTGGGTTTDQSINTNTGTLGSTTAADASDPTWVTGKFSNALSFDGSDDYVEISDSPTLDGMSGLTIEAWINTRTFDSKGVISKQTGYHFPVFVNSGEFTVELQSQDNGSYTWHVYPSPPLQVNRWYHYVATWTNNGGILYVYLDGQRIHSGTGASGDVIYNSANPVRVGRGTGNYGTNTYFDGTVDEVRIYNRALSAREIHEHYRQKAPSLAQGGTVSGNLYVLSGNIVGIGTTTPAQTLTIKAASTTPIFGAYTSSSVAAFVINSAGDITTGTWKATPIGAAYGGTGTSTANWTGVPYITSGVWGTTTVQTGTEKYGPTIIVAASNSTNTARAHYQCDGTNDQEEINAAIQALYPTGGTVLLLEGNFFIASSTSAGINIATSNIAIVGSGRGTILYRDWDTAINDGVIMAASSTGATTTGIVISNLSINGCKATSTVSACKNAYIGGQNIGIYFNQKISQSRIQNTWVYDCDGEGIFLDSNTGIENTRNIIQGNDVRNNEDGIVLWESDDNIITGNITQFNTSYYGIYLGQSHNNTIFGNDSRFNTWDGIYLYQSDGNTISNNTIRSNSSDGIELEDYCDYNTIIGNNIQSNTNSGIIFINEIKNSTVIGNIIQSNGNYGIYLYGTLCDNNTITGNVINESGYDGIYVESSDNNVISSNRIYDSSGSNYGINIYNSSSDNNYLIGNEISGAGFTAEVRDAGTGTTIQHRDLFEIEQTSASATSTALTVTQSGTGNIVDFKSGATSVFTLKSADQLELRAGLVQGWGDFNDKIIDDFEDNDVSNWNKSDATNTKVFATTTYVKVNDYGMVITTVASSSANASNGDTATSSVSNENWSGYEKLSFWIKADYTTTSTNATTSQLISIQFNDTASGAQTHTVTINEMTEWQYEEWDISGISSAGRDVVNWVGFRIDNDYGSPRFYIDHIRLYDADLQAAEMFVDNKGNLTIWGQKTVEIGRTSPGGSLPSIRADSAVVELNQPLSVNVGGDVGFDYDIYFANTGLSSITSEGPLKISAGDADHYENLTLTTGGEGDVIIDIADSKFGFKVMSWPSGGYVAQITSVGNFEVSQNISNIGGYLTLNQLLTPSAPSFSSTSTGGSCANTTYYYRVTAANDNGETLASATTSVSTQAASTVINLSWVPVSGATKYYFYRSTNSNFGAGYTASSTLVSATSTSYADDCSGDTNRVVPSSNTTGGSLKLTGGPNLPTSPTEGELFFSTSTKQLYIYSNGKWQADRTVATKIVAATSSQNYQKADYVCSGASCEDEINSAFSALPSTGGVVYLLEGEYLMATSTYSDCSIKIASSTALVGAGASTILKLKDSFNADLKVICNSDTTAGNSYILISNLKLDGNKVNNSGGIQYGIFFNKMGSGSGSSAKAGAKIEKCVIENFRTDGIYFTYSSNNTISGNTVQGNGGNGIYLNNFNYNNTITGNIVQSNTLYWGIYLSSSSNNTISGNFVQGNSDTGIYLYSCTSTTITGNTSQGNSYHGIHLNSSNNNTITGNTAQGNSWYGIQLESSSNNTITGNKIHDNGGSGNYDGIYIYNNSDANLISSNDITDTAGGATAYAIEITSSDCDNNYLVGNRYSGTGASTISDSGTNTSYGSQLFGTASLSTSTAPNLILKPSGYVGIGTTTPVTTLTVYGTTTIMGGNVGIGTTTPKAPLHVTQVGPDPGLLLSRSGQVTAGITLSGFSGGALAGGGDIIAFGDPEGDKFMMNLVYAGTNVGNVGIGTTTPAYTLDVYGTLRALSTSTFFGRVGIGTTTPGSRLTIVGSDNTSSNSSLNVTNASNTSLLFVRNDGNVGIGTTTPYQALTVYSSSTDMVAYFRNIHSSAGQGIGAYVNNPSANGYVLDVVSTAKDYIRIRGSGETFFGAGNVGIATSSPAYTLDVYGTTSVRAFRMPTGASSTYVLTSDASGIGTWQLAAGGTEKYGPTLIVAAQNSTTTSRAHYQCDGTEDQVEINAAIQQLASTTGGTVLLLEGTYNIATSGINITTSSIALVGSGRNTLLKRAWDATSSDGVITVGDGTTTILGVVISNLQIDGQKATYTGVENIGIYFNQKVSQSIIKNIWVHDNDGSGIDFYAASAANSNSNNLIQGSDVRSNDSYGIHFEYSSNNYISDNNCWGNADRSIYINNSSNNNSITGNNAQSNGNNYGIAIRSSSYNTVTGNNSQSNTVGIYISNGATNNTITGNLIYDVGSSNDGISLSTSDNNIISSNNIYDLSGSRYGINVSDVQSDNNYIIGNEISGAGFTAEINDAGTGTTIQQRDWFEVEASTTLTALTVLQTGTGTIANFSNATGSVFTIANNGTVTVAGNILPATTTAYNLGSSDYKWANIYAATATIGSTITINTNTISGSGTTTINTTAGNLILNPFNYVGIGTTNPQAKLTVAGSGIIGSGSVLETFTLQKEGTADASAQGKLSSKVVFKGSGWQTSSWSSTTVDTGMSYLTKISLELDSSGNPVIAYYDDVADDLKLVHCNDNNCTGGDESIVTIQSGGDVGDAPSLKLDSLGYPVISYAYGDSPPSALRLVHCNDANCAGGDDSIQDVWSTSTGGAGVQYTSLQLDSSGYPVIAFYLSWAGDLYLAHCNDVNCSGSNESIEVVESTNNVGDSASLKLDSSGYPVIAYTDGTNYDIKLAHCNDANCALGGESIVTVDATNTLSNTSLELDSLGYPVISYSHWINGQRRLKLAHCNDVNCTGGDESIEVPHEPGWYFDSTSLELNTSGYPVIAEAIYDSVSPTECWIYLVTCNDANCAGANESIVTVDNFDSQNSCKSVSLELDTSNYTVMSYYKNGALKLARNAGGSHAEDVSFALQNIVTNLSDYRLAVKNTTGSEFLTINSLGNVGIGTTTPSEMLTIRAASTNAIFGAYTSSSAAALYVASSGNVGIGTTSPTGKLHIYGPTSWDSPHLKIQSTAYGTSSIIQAGDGLLFRNYYSTGTNIAFGFRNATDTHLMDITTAGNVGIGTTSPVALLHVFASSTASALTVTQSGTGNIVDLKSGATSVFTLASADRLKLRDGLLATFGEFNDVVLDDFESGSVSGWTSSDNTNTKVSATTTQVKVNDYAMAITTVVGSSGNDSATTTPATTTWSSYERLGFWIRADYTSTSTSATTSQIISFRFYDSTGTTTNSSTTIKEFGRWQYEEIDLSTLLSTDKDNVTWFGFRINNDYGSPRFYIDQIRLYDYPERTSEVFVDSNGNLNFVSPSKIELTRTTPGQGSLPSISVDSAVVELNQPLSVNVGGDVGFDYDIYFANTGLSSITSEGPLRIAAGDPNHYENLTLTTGGTGDIIMEIASSTIGYKVLGSDSGGYVFRIAPSGDVEIGGSGFGGSDLTVKQNVSLTGGNITINQLSTPSSAPTLSTSTSGFCSATTYYYRITAANDNGQTLGSATTTITPAANQLVVVSFSPVSGSTKHYIWRSTDNSWGDDDDYRIEVLAPATSYNDTCTSTQATSIYPTANTTGGSLTFTGGTTFPTSPSEGQMFFRTDNKQVYVYANNKWQADRTVATKIVAATSSSNYEKADYVCSGASCEDEINSAFSALPSTGGVVYLLDGEYTMGTSTYSDCSIKMATSTALIGAGPSTVLKIKNSFNADLRVICNSDTTNGNSRIYISHLKLDGNKAQNSTGIQHGIYFYKVGSGTSTNALPGVKIENIWVENCTSTGIYISTSNNNTITGSTIQGNSQNGIYIYYSDNNTIAGNTFQGNTLDGISLYDSDSNAITGNAFQGNIQNGIHLNISDNNTIAGNTFQGNSSRGIYFETYNDNNTITGNTIQGNNTGIMFYATNTTNTINGNTIQGSYSGGGIDFYSSSNNNNIISGNKIHDNYEDGIRLKDNSDSNLISSNDITDTTGGTYAIDIEASNCDNNYLVGNRYSGTGASSINDAGTGTSYGSQLFGSATLSTSTAPNLILKPSGYVGIGTTTPVTTLTVYGTTTIMGGNVGIGTTTPASRLTIVGSDNTSSTSGFNVTNASGTSLLFVRNDGNVGIGTTTPDKKLHIYGTDSNNTYLKIESGAYDPILLLRSPNTRYPSVYFAEGTDGPAASISWMGPDDDLRIYNQVVGSDSDIYFKTDGGVVYIKGSGNVGIGTTSPSQALEVYQNSNAIGTIKSTNVSTGTLARAGLTVAADAATGYLSTYSSGYTGGGDFAHLADSVLLGAESDASAGLEIVTGAAAPIKFFTGGFTTTSEKMRIDANGNVGIGKTTPGEKLEVAGGNILIGGKSAATSTTWTDVMGTPATTGVAYSLAVYNDQLYAGDGYGNVYRYDGGTTWTDVVGTPATLPSAPWSLAVYNGQLYAGEGGNVYRYDGATTWTDVMGTPATIGNAYSLAVYNGQLYVGDGIGNVYRYDGGTTWTDVMGTPATVGTVESLAVYNGQLYAGEAGGNVYRYTATSTWTDVVGTPATIGTVESLAVYNGQLYTGDSAGNVYRYDGATTWTDVMGTPATTGVAYSLAVYNDQLYVGDGIGNVYRYTANPTQSYALKFKSDSEIASLWFRTGSSGQGNESQNQHGQFIFSHGIITNSGAYDIAEDYSTIDSSLSFGEVVSLDSLNPGHIIRSSHDYQSDVIGVISTQPGFLLAGNTNSNTIQKSVTLVGRTSVRVSTENGPIEIGDYLTSSNVPGVAMKATEPGMAIGMALEPFGSTQNNPDENTDETQIIGKIMVFVSPHWSIGQLLEDGSLTMATSTATTTDATTTEQAGEQLSILDRFTLAIKNSLKKLGLFIENGIAKVKGLFAEKVRANQLEMVDKATGEIYCTWIENGEWVKARGECDATTTVETSSTSTEEQQPPTEQLLAVCDYSHLNLCLTETDCIFAGGFWYNDVCDAKGEAQTPPVEETSTPEETPVEQPPTEEPPSEEPATGTEPSIETPPVVATSTEATSTIEQPPSEEPAPEETPIVQPPTEELPPEEPLVEEGQVAGETVSEEPTPEPILESPTLSEPEPISFNEQ